MHSIAGVIYSLYEVLWGPPMLILLIGTGIFMTIRTKGFQFRKFGLAMKNTVGKLFDKTDVKEGSLSPVQAMTTALAGTVGTGNIAGVTGAIALGGPGAVFWMWVSAMFGMVTKFSEVTLSVRYREKNELGDWVGGPMYYIKNGLGKHWKWLGVLFALFAAIAAMGIGNMTQINTIVTSVGSIFTQFNPATTTAQLKTIYLVVGIIVAILTTMVLFGGLNRIGAVTEKLVPGMAMLYVLSAVVVVVFNYRNIGPVFADIFKYAFNPQAVGGGLAGTGIKITMQMGIGRGIFSNEAGLGSAPIAHAAADTDHPVRQGMFGIFEVFAASMVICTFTALAVLTSGVAGNFYGKSAGTNMAISAFSTTFGGKLAAIIIALCITMFALSTILSWSLYGTRCAEFLFGTKIIKPYQIVFVAFVVIGAVTKMDLVWTIADDLNAMMAIPNLIAVIALSPEIIRLIKDFLSDDPQYTCERLEAEAEKRRLAEYHLEKKSSAEKTGTNN